MAKTLDGFRRKLFEKILFSSTPQDVRRFSNTAIRSLKEHNVHEYIIARFIDKLMNDFEVFNPLCIDEKQKNNICTAADYFRQVRKKYVSNTVS